MDELVKLTEEVLEIRMKTLIDNHPGTVEVMTVGETLRQQGKLIDALKSLEQVSEGWTSVLGPTHRKTGIAVLNVASLHSTLGNFDTAIELATKAVEITVALLGEEHLYSISDMRQLATILREQKKHAKAATQLEKAVELGTKMFGPDHFATLPSRVDLGWLRVDQSRLDEALEIHEAILEVRVKDLGEKHILSLLAMKSVAAVQRLKGNWKEAAKAEEDTLNEQIYHSLVKNIHGCGQR